MVAGEASADLHGANLVNAIKSLDPGIRFIGIGDKKMAGAGVDIILSSSELAVVGLTEVFLKLCGIFRAFFTLRTILKKWNPHLLILLDYPDFNIALAGTAKRFKVPVLYYISPQVWAWRKGRIKKIANRVDRMAVILPFEAPLYRDSGLEVDYVGHPLLDTMTKRPNRAEVRRDFGIEDGDPVIGLLPGSRNEEVKNLMPLMVNAIEKLHSRYPDLKCLLHMASTISMDLIQPYVDISPVDIKMIEGNVYLTLAACDLAMVASGTATLETAIMGVPMVILYRVSRISYWIGKRVIRVPHIGLVNLVAEDEVVPELIQDDVTPDRLVKEVLDILEGGQTRENMIKKLKIVTEKLGQGGASEKTARIALEMMSQAKKQSIK